MNEITKEIGNYIFDNYYDLGNVELTKCVNEKFKTTFNICRIKNFKKKYKLKSKFTGRFEKGHIPYSKGKKHEELFSKKAIVNIQKTQFKKGQIPKNKLPLGSEVLRNDGYVWVKVKEPNIWNKKHKVLWEQYHQTKIPKYSCITFLDGNRSNFDIENLKLITKTENCYLNSKDLRFNSSELTNVGISVARVEIRLLEIKNKGR